MKGPRLVKPSAVITNRGTKEAHFNVARWITDPPAEEAIET
jgi:hypothetical protein